MGLDNLTIGQFANETISRKTEDGRIPFVNFVCFNTNQTPKVFKTFGV